MKQALLTAALMLSWAPAERAIADEVVATLTLDSSSRIVIDGSEPLLIPAGSTIKMRFGDPDAKGERRVEILRGDSAILPVLLPDGRLMKYTIAGRGEGYLRAGELRFGVTVQVALASKGGREARSYPLTLTTGQTVALNDKRSRVVQTQGARVSRSSRSVKLVGGTTNASDAAVGRGAAVTAVLSGTFDRLP